MTAAEATELLRRLQEGTVSLDKVLAAFQRPPETDLGFAKIDSHRGLRKGFPEVVYGAGKTTDQILKIARSLQSGEKRVLITRVTEEQGVELRRKIRGATHHSLARCVTIGKFSTRPLGRIAILCAGTSDLPVAEEAAVTAEIMGNRVDRFTDIGVAGLHRLLSRLDEIRQAHVVVAVAGMEGALPSVVAGLVFNPVIAVPTSVGYGASFGGLAALLGMLNSCGSGVTVVNIDNGFGAGYAASQINQLASRKDRA